MLKNTAIGTLIEKLKTLNEEIVWFHALVNEEFKQQFVGWIQEQLQSGEDGKGDVMGLYSFATEIISGGEKKEGDPFTLKDSGDFYNSMFLVVMSDSLQLEADYEKPDGTELNLEYGNAITDLNDENIEKIKEIVVEKYIEYINDLLR